MKLTNHTLKAAVLKFDRLWFCLKQIEIIIEIILKGTVRNWGIFLTVSTVNPKIRGWLQGKCYILIHSEHFDDRGFGKAKQKLFHDV